MNLRAVITARPRARQLQRPRPVSLLTPTPASCPCSSSTQTGSGPVIAMAQTAPAAATVSEGPHLRSPPAASSISYTHIRLNTYHTLHGGSTMLMVDACMYVCMHVCIGCVGLPQLAFGPLLACRYPGCVGLPQLAFGPLLACRCPYICVYTACAQHGFFRSQNKGKCCPFFKFSVLRK